MRRLWLLALMVSWFSPFHAPAGEPVVKLGAGSYSRTLPPGAKTPPRQISAVAGFSQKMPTNDWWSSLAWLPFSERQFPHPLGVQAEAGGLRLFYAGASVTANRDGIFGFSPGPGGGDLTLGHAGQPEFAAAEVESFSDWFVTARFQHENRVLRVSYGHGSPFVFAQLQGGSPRVTFQEPPRVWSGNADSSVLGLTIGSRHYGLFAPRGATWAGLGTSRLTCITDRPYFSVAVLPDSEESTLKLFARHAHAHVVGTRVSWQYDAKTSKVATTFDFQTQAFEGDEQQTLFALYPHQWRHTPHNLLEFEYNSVRGRMKVGRGKSFQTVATFPGVLPCLPNVGGADRGRMTAYLQAEAAVPDEPPKDTYWEGKRLGRLATLVAIAAQYDQPKVADVLLQRVRLRLEDWFTAADAAGQPKPATTFYYDDLWGTLIGYPASFGSDNELNDHHFHYGYFLRAAAELALRDPDWAKDEHWGSMVKLLIRDVANANRHDPLFPFLRNFDPYAGHSWASGHAKFADGNNNESSSEGMNAWCALILWGEATGDRAVRDLGIYLFTTEMLAIDEYWFDVQDHNRPREYTPAVVTMVWGGKGANATWFTANPEAVHGINWLPLHGGSLYLGRFPEYVARNYAALVAENRGATWDEWPDLIWMYQALAEPGEAAHQFAAAERPTFEAGNSPANTCHWIGSLQALGHVERSVTADVPLYAVFEKAGVRKHCAYNPLNRPLTVTFSDNHQMRFTNRGFKVE